MNLVEDNDIKRTKMSATKKVIIAFIIILSILCVAIVVLIMYRLKNPTQITTYIDGKLISGFDAILDIQTDENGNTKIYVPIREFATYLNAANSEFNYKTYKGDYNPKTEDDSKCYVIRDKYEVAIFTKGSKTVYKLNLQTGSDDYEECYIDTDIYESNGKLFISTDGIEQSYNVQFSYNEPTKTINIYTLDYFIQTYKTSLANRTIGEYGTMTIEDGNYTNCKSIFNNLLIVKNSNGKYGIITTNYSKFILEPQYDDIDFVNDSETFLVKSNGKVGLFSKDGSRKIDLIYDEITLMEKKSNLYMVKTNNQYGVVNEDGDIIIYPEYSKIGTDISSFGYNDVKNGYIILDTLIPVQQNGKWAIFNTQGKMITDGFKYTYIGCKNVRSGNNIYPLLQLPEYNVIVVGDENKKYSFMDTSGNDEILPFVFDEVFIKMTSGETSYLMTTNQTDYNILDYLK